MPILENEFHCPNGHSFIANAKIRARCPECGERATRNFTPAAPPKPDGDKGTKKPTIKAPVLLRRGKARVMPIKKAPAKVASKHTVTKAKPPVKKPVAKKPAITKPVTRASNGLVKTTHITARGTTPQVKRPPAKTAVARHIKSAVPDRRKGSYIDEVISKYGPGR